MSLYTQFKTDKELEKSGILLDFGLNKRTSTEEAPKRIAIRIARAGGANQLFEKMLEARTKPHLRAIQNESVERSVLEGIWHEVYARAVVIGWENVDFEETPNGPAMFDVPYTPENALRLFKDLPDLFIDIRTQAMKWSSFRTELKEIAAKN
jgi:hypothetical protein